MDRAGWPRQAAKVDLTMSIVQQRHTETCTLLTRRGFFDRVGSGTYGAALAYLLGKDLSASAASSFDVKPRVTHFPPRARSVIQLVMQGGPSQIDLFDPKPKLNALRGKEPSREMLANTDVDLALVGGLLPSPFRFAQHGQSGIWLSELLPHLARQVDRIAVI